MKTTLLFLSVFLSVNLFGQHLIYVTDDALEEWFELSAFNNDNYVETDTINVGIPMLSINQTNPSLVVNDWTGLNELKVNVVIIQNNNVQTIDLSNWGTNSYIYNTNANGNGVQFVANNCNLLTDIILPQDTITVNVQSCPSLQNIVFQNSNIIRFLSIGYSGNLNGLNTIDLSNTSGFDFSGAKSVQILSNVNCIKLDNGTMDCLNLSSFAAFNPFTNFSVCVEVSQPSLMQATFPLAGGYSTNCTNCSISSIDEHSLKKPFLLKVTDLMGRETTFKPNTPLIYVYDDGSIEKVFSVEY